MNLRPRQSVGEARSPTVIHEFTYSAGRVTESVAQPALIPRSRSIKGLIHVVVDVDGAGRSSDQLRHAFVQFFQTSASRSITSTLQHAVQHLNEELLADNDRSVRNDWCFATLACAVIREADTYIALAGPAVCYVIGSSGFERFGRADSRPGDRSVARLGQVEEIGVELFHRPTEDLAELVLSSSGIADLGGESFEHLLETRDGSVSRLIRRLAAQHRGKRRFSAAVLSFGEADDDHDGTRPVIRGLPQTARVPVHENGKDRTRSPRPSVPSESRAPASRPSGPPPPPRSRPEPSLTGPKLEAAPPPTVPEEEPDSADGGRLSRLRARLFAIPPRRVASPDLEWSGPEQNRVRRRPRRRPIPTILDRQTSQLVDWDSPEEAIATRVSPADPRTTSFGAQWPGLRPVGRAGGPRLPAATLRVAIIALALLALFYVGYLAIQLPLRIFRESTDAASAIGKLSRAEQREREALAETDPLTRRRLLDEASQLASQAAIERPESSAVATASTRIRTEYQTAVGTTRLGAPLKVLDLPSSADEMVLVTPNLFVLDRANSRVYSFLLNIDGTSAQPSSNPVLVRKGDHVGPATVGDLLHLSWIPSGNGRKTDNLVILDSAGFLIQYEPTRGLGLLALQDGQPWTDALVLRGYDGNLYAVSARQKKLTVYPAQPTGYDAGAENYFTSNVPVDLSDTASFVVDKNLFLLHESGRIESFTNGAPNSFIGPPDDMAPRNPVGFAVSSDSVFVGDPTRSRLIQLTRNGDFQRSLSLDDPGPLTRLRDLTVSDDGQALYVLSDRTIYRFNLPKS